MPKQKRLIEYFRVGLTDQMKEMLNDLIASSGISYQTWVTMQILKEYENKSGKRNYRFSNRLENRTEGNETVGAQSEQDQIDAEEWENEQERIRAKYEEEDKKSDQANKNLKEIKAFKWKMSKPLKRKIWGSIAIVAPHLIDSYKEDPNVRILKTVKDLEAAKLELEEINEFILKKELEFDKKYGTDRNSPKWIQAWNTKVDA